MSPQKKFYAFTGMLIIAAWCWVVLNLNKLPGDGTTVCIFKRVTGWPCPACGTSRSVVALLHGQWAKAAWLNPEGYLAVGLLLLVPCWLLFDAWKRKTTLYSFYLQSISRLEKNRYLYGVFICLIVINWIWNFHKHL